MNRRQFVAGATTGAAGLIAGCVESLDDTVPRTFDTSEYPPYPEGETLEFSGDGPSSREFEVTHDGPVVVDIAHAGDGDFTVRILDSEQVEEDTDEENTDNETVETQNGEELDTPGVENHRAIEGVVAEVTGPLEGQSIHALDQGSYMLDVIDANNEWDATIHFVPVYGDASDVGVGLPVVNTGVFHSVVGPINFGELHKTSFSFESNDGMIQRVYLHDREGEIVYVLFDVDGDVDETVSVDVSGIGYVSVETTGSWELNIEEHVGESVSDQHDDEDEEDSEKDSEEDEGADDDDYDEESGDDDDTEDEDEDGDGEEEDDDDESEGDDEDGSGDEETNDTENE